ncbi:hypothetical protein DL96DRAFT_159409 [Flagelloscypha sp. PMI_526]|nr:hypothetical protein DL96DRAFT_159409 [Flagelloscypha sp. PMI_526]
MTSTATQSHLNLPPELWSAIAGRLSSKDIWNCRFLNKTFYNIAVTAYYRDVVLVPHTNQNLDGILKKICEPPIAKLVETLQIHSNINAGVRSSIWQKASRSFGLGFGSSSRRLALMNKALFQPCLQNVKRLTIAYDTKVLPYTERVLSQFKDSLVCLELQITGNAGAQHIESLGISIECPRLQTFIFWYGLTLYPPLLSPIAAPDHRIPPRLQEAPTVVDYTLMFQKLKLLVPSTLTSLALPGNYLDHIPGISVFLTPDSLPYLKSLHISESSHVSSHVGEATSFVTAHASMLESLTLDHKGIFWPSLQLSENLKELQITSLMFLDKTQPWLQAIRGCQRLEKLIIHPDGRYTAFLASDSLGLLLLVALSEAGGAIVELRFPVFWPITIQFLLGVVTLLPRLDTLELDGARGVEVQNGRGIANLPILGLPSITAKDWVFIGLARKAQVLDLTPWMAIPRIRWTEPRSLVGSLIVSNIEELVIRVFDECFYIRSTLCSTQSD